jgi:hypothetical protein
MRVLPLFDPKATPQNWNERMSPGEFAVLFSNLQPLDLPKSPVAVIFPTLSEAEDYATAQTEALPALRCSVYDDNGLGREPIRVIAGAQGHDRNVISSGFRRWVGGALLLIGLIFGFIEWRADSKLMWAGTLASRIGPIGFILLITELGIVLTDRQKRRKEQQPRP